MIGNKVILLALFSNFLGRYAANAYISITGGKNVYLIPPNEFTDESAIEMMIILIISFIIYKTIRCPTRIIRTEIVAQENRKMINFLTFIFIIVGVWNLLTVNTNLDISGRGVGQFDRSGWGALSRAIILLLPLFVFYRVSYNKYKHVKMVALFFVVSVTLNSFLAGDRRLAVYFMIAMAMIYAREINVYNTAINVTRKPVIKQKFGSYISHYVAGLIAVCSLIAVFMYRGSKEESGVYVDSIAVFLFATVGSLGDGAILSEVKALMSDTGVLHGETIIESIKTLLVPSAVLYFIGLDEFTGRGSYLFNSYFNTNPNMGYDFMLLAEFFWNFSYFGYICFLVLAWIVMSSVARLEGGNNYKFCLSVLIVVLFVAGQRSDIGFFLKSLLFCWIFTKIIFLLGAMPHRKHLPPS